MNRTLALCALGATVLHGQAPAPSVPKGPNVLVGRVLDIGTEVPVGGAIVTLDGFIDPFAEPAAAEARTGSTARHVLTTADGHFVFRDLPAGRYSVATAALGYVTNDYPPYVVELSDGDRPKNVVLRLWRLAAISGRVIDERGDPVVGMSVVPLQRVTAGNSLVLRRVYAGTSTDDRGVYRLSQLTPGSYVVGVLSSTASLPADLASEIDRLASSPGAVVELTSALRRSGFIVGLRGGEGHRVGQVVLQRPGPALPPSPDGRLLGHASVLYPGTSNPSEAAVITLGSGESREGVDIPLRFGPTVSVSGIALGPDGPMRQLAVHLVPPGFNLNDIEPIGLATAITDARGAFVLPAVTPGDYVLGSLFLAGDEMTGEGQSLWTTELLTVGDTDIEGLIVTMRPGLRVSGRVEFEGAAGSTSPASRRMVVSLQPVGAQAWRTYPAVVRPDGTFTSMGDPPGRYIVNASAPPGWTWQATSLRGRPIADEPIELDARDVSDLVLTFAQSSTRLSGTVVDQAGAPDPDADVIVFPADTAAWREGAFTSRRVRRVHATTTGAFDFSALPPGDYSIAAVDARLAIGWQNPAFLERLTRGAERVSLGAGEEKTVSLRTLVLPNR